MKGDAKAISFVEDTAVNPGRLRDYIDRFFQIGSKQQKISGIKNLAQAAKKFRAGGSVEIADGAAQKKH